jgi:5'-3' exonuclease
MTEATSGGEGRAEWERRLINRSLEDEEFRRRLLDDPKGTLEQELGSRLPEGVEVRVVEESTDTIYLVLPSATALDDQGDELSEEELEAVAGGLGDRYTDNDDTCGGCDTAAGGPWGASCP